MKNKTFWLAPAIALALPIAAVSQAHPADPGAPTEALGYRSAFSDYKPWQDIKPADWRDMNDKVRDAAARPQPAAAPSPAATHSRAGDAVSAPTGPAGHQGHGSHK